MKKWTSYWVLFGFYVIAAFQGVEALDYDYGKAKKFEVPKRDYSVIISDEGYYPKHISIFEGEKIQFFVTTTTDTPSCLMIPEKKIYLAARPGKISEASAYFDKPGIYKYYCPTGKISGRITVLEKVSAEEKVKRELASKPKVRIWLPREE